MAEFNFHDLKQLMNWIESGVKALDSIANSFESIAISQDQMVKLLEAEHINKEASGD